MHGTDEMKLLDCPKCYGSYKSKKKLQRHLKFVHDKIKPFSCDVCELSFPETSKLKRHLGGEQHKVKANLK